MNCSLLKVVTISLGMCLASFVSSSVALAIPGEFVVLRAMDKITARVSTITVPVGSTVNFGSLEITAKACDKHPPEETPEASAFLNIVEAKQGEEPQSRFMGWMFASSPALSALEHPVYDLWVLDCTDEAAKKSAQPADSEPSKSSTTESGTTP